jgi:hypothetical protein
MMSVARINKCVETTDHILFTEVFYENAIELFHASVFLMSCSCVRKTIKFAIIQ